jgi:hypothetical protein
MPQADTETLNRPNTAPLAYRRHAGRAPVVVWLGGFRSDMTGTKAQALSDWAAQAGQAFVRFDYRGHGASGGAFEDFAIGDWAADALAVIDSLTEGPLVLVGSSMGAWIALLAARARAQRVSALTLIAPATDFTEALMRPSLPPEALAAMAAHGRWERPSAYGDGPYVFTQRLLDEGRNHLLLESGVPFTGPVRILQGQEDADVPWRHALRTADAIASRDVTVTLIKDGDHRLSRPQDIAMLIDTVAQLCA